MLEDTLVVFNEKLSSKEAVPGGGGAAALCGALAASLSSMVTALTIGKKRYREFEEENQKIAKKAAVLRDALLKGIEEDAEAFLPLSQAYSKDKSDPDYEEDLEKCLKDAAMAPYRLMESIAEVVVLDEQLVTTGSKLAISDAASSAALAYGALLAAKINVLVNTRLMRDKTAADELNAKSEALLQEYSARALSVYKKVEERLNG